MSSNVNSEGVPIDHDGFALEDHLGFQNSSVPVAINPAVLREILSGANSNGHEPFHLDSDPLEDYTSGFARGEVLASSSGGIPIERASSVSSDEILSPRSARILVDGQENALLTAEETSQAVMAAFSVSKLEREELIMSRVRVNDLNNFILRNGFKLDEVDDFLRKDGFLKPKIVRDENGLPILRKKNVENVDVPNFVAKSSSGKFIEGKDRFGLPNFIIKTGEPLKSILKNARGECRKAGELVGEVSGVKDDRGKEKDKEIPKVNVHEDGPKENAGVGSNKSWAAILKTDKVQKTQFEFTPPVNGSVVVDPPDDILQAGIDKLKLCFTGHFSRGTIPFSTMNSEANKAWGKKGLVKVSQKDERTFVFRFSSIEEKNNILTRGTWYFARKPMVVIDCCPESLVAAKVTKMPIWIKLTNIPDSYWTRDLLGRLASVVGKPLFADNLTTQLDVLPFARFCVEYSLGDPLPDCIEAMVKDPISGIKSVVKIVVHYQTKPQTCSACNSLGHNDLICPSAQHRWVKTGKTLGVTTAAEKISEVHKSVEVTVPGEEQVVVENIVKDNCDILKKDERENEGWHTVQSKNREKRGVDADASPIDSPIDSPTPVSNFKSLKSVDEIDLLSQEASKKKKKLSKSARKKLKRNSGIASPEKE